MKKWYFLVLVLTVVGGWYAYPHAYPKLAAFIEDGVVPWEGFGTWKSDSVEQPEETASIGNTSSPAPTATTPKRTRPKATPPTFASIEEVVGNWKKIPDSAFPRKIKLKKVVSYSIAGGTGSLPIGSDVVALSFDGISRLTIAPNEESALRARVAIDDTDFKTVLTGVYEKFKQRKLAEFEAAQAEIAANEPDELAVDENPTDPQPGMATGRNTPMPAKSANIDAKTRALIGKAPLQYVDGTVPVMVRSIESGQVTEIKPDMVTYWGRMHYGVVQGEPYWVGRVDYTAGSIFGIFPTQAKALIRKGKVIKWIYTGSEEPVP